MNFLQLLRIWKPDPPATIISLPADTTTVADALAASAGQQAGRQLKSKFLCIMKLIVFILLAFCLHVSAGGFSQSVTIQVKDAPLYGVLTSIEKQTGFTFIAKEELLNSARAVTLNLKDVPLVQALDACFKGQPLQYYMNGTIIVVKPLSTEPTAVVAPTAFIAPPITVRGRITNEDGKPLAGASVSLKNSKSASTSSNADGVFSLNVSAGDVLVISYVGYQSTEYKLTGAVIGASDGQTAAFTIALKQDIKDLDETVVVAYNKISQRSNTGSVTVVKGEEIRDLPNRSFDKSLQGLVPGLLVTSGTGQPGGGLSNFVLRGISTGSTPNAASTLRNPLMVVDGIPVSQDNYQFNTSVTTPPVINPIAQLNPSDIESITVLKDATAIALYGSKASNGVILVTTKQGKAGRTKVNFRQQTDVAKRLSGKIKLLNQQEYLALLSETYKNTPTTPAWTDSSVLAFLKLLFPVRSDGSFYPETNWQDELYTDHASTISNELSVSGGNEKNTFYLNFEYTKQNGVFKKTGYDRKSLRLNFETKAASWLKLGLNTFHSYNVQDYATLVGGTFPLGVAAFFPPLVPARKEDGSLILNYTFPFPVANPLAAMDYNVNQNIAYRGLSKLYAELSFLRDFKFIANAGFDFMLLEAKEKIDPRLYDYELKKIGPGQIRERDTRTINLISTNVLRFDKTFGGDHNVSILAGQEAQIQMQKFLMGTATGLSVTSFGEISNGSSTGASGERYKRTQLSYFTQGNYAYRNKYFLSASTRADGASSFGENERFSTYWSLGGGWIASAESFMQTSNRWLNFLKLRGSLGAAGNASPISQFTRYDLLEYASYFGAASIVPIRNDPANPNIRPEKTFNWNIGLDARFWNNRIAFTADVYKKNTSDLIYSTLLPLASGYSRLLDNIGNIENKGIEITLSADVARAGNFRWNVSGNWSTNSNRLIKANVPLATISGDLLANEEGRNFNSYYMIRWAGVNSGNGSGQWIDSTGKPNSNYEAAKKSFVGKPQPDGFGAVTNTFTYRNFQLSCQFYYQYGFQIYEQSGLTNDGSNTFLNQEKRALDFWRKPGDQSKNPKRYADNFDNLVTSTRELYNGDFIRLQNVSFNYNFPKNITSRLHLSMLKIFLQAYNVAIWTKYPGGDVADTNIQGGNAFEYPNQRSFTGGINITF